MNSNRLVCLALTAMVIVPSPFRWEQEYRMKLGVLVVALPLIGLPPIGLPLLMAQSGAVIEGTASNKITDAGIPGVTIMLAASGPFNCTRVVGMF